MAINTFSKRLLVRLLVLQINVFLQGNGSFRNYDTPEKAMGEVGGGGGAVESDSDRT